ncbi:MAG: hypothetical protein WC269_01520 [Candidatus Gracilibacteria bacterium]
MRSVLSISLPAIKKIEIERRAKKANKTVSLYIIDVLELASHMISEDELVSMAKKAESDYKQGKTKKLNNLAELMK